MALHRQVSGNRLGQTRSFCEGLLITLRMSVSVSVQDLGGANRAGTKHVAPLMDSYHLLSSMNTPSSKHSMRSNAPTLITQRMITYYQTQH